MSEVSMSTTCRVCLASDREMYRLANTALEETYERVTSGTLVVEGRPSCVCGVCLAALRRCRRFIDTAREANDALDRWIQNHPNTDMLKLTERPLFSFTQSPMTNFEIMSQESVQEQGVKQEKDMPENEDSEMFHHQNKDTSDDEGNILKEEIKCEVTSDDDSDNTQMSDNIESHNTQVVTKSECINVYDEMIEIEIDPQALYDIKYVPKRLGNDECQAAPGVSNVKCEDIKLGPALKNRRPITSEHRRGNTDPAATLHNKGTMFSCNQCNYNSKNKKLLKAHFTKHTGIKPFACDKCDYKCNYKGSLKKHYLRHTIDKPFFCDKCDYKCYQMGHLRRHLLLHTGEKPFTCDQCDYKSVQKGDLKRHLLTHTGEKPFSCSKCDYKCIQKGTLKRHLLTHDGEKPFSCDKCENNKYTSKSALYKHMRKFHPDRNLEIANVSTNKT